MAERDHSNARSYLYGSAGMGADVAAWTHAARAELAAVTGRQYGQGVLDLVKA